MTSILTNVSAMAAIQTLRSINSSMETTQARVSSGLRVGTASDNAAYWSIATTMRSDNMALSAVQDALGLGAAKVDTAYSAMESVVDVVEEIKKKLVAATEDGVDKSKIQEEIKQLQEQLKSISQSASFSGENWLEEDLSKGDITKSVVGSFVRSSDGTVRVQKINYDLNSSTVLFDKSKNAEKLGILDSTAKIEGKRVNVEVTSAKPVTVTGESLAAGGSVMTAATGTAPDVYTTTGGELYVRYNDTNGQVRDANGKDMWVKVVDAAAAPATPNNVTAKAPNGSTPLQPVTAANKYYIVTSPVTETHSVAATTKAALDVMTAKQPAVSPATTAADIAIVTSADYANVAYVGAVATINYGPYTEGVTPGTYDVPAKTETYIKLGADDVWVKATRVTLTAPETYSNGVKADLIVGGTAGYFVDAKNSVAPGKVETDFKVSVSTLDITKLADLALQTGYTQSEVLDHLVEFVDTQFEAITSASASLGSISMRIGMQEDFISKLTDSIDKGVGRLVDADMNEESTRLKALQTQQQLAIQALSIANSTSENILSLFRQ